MDANAAEAVRALVEADEDFARLVKAVATKALATQAWFLAHGTPSEKLQVAKAFLPVFTKALVGDKTDTNTEDMKAKVRDMITDVLAQ